VRLEDEAVMAEQALGPVPGPGSPFLDLRPNAESDARVLLEPLHEAVGLVAAAIRLAGVGLDGRLRLFVVKRLDLALSLGDLVVRVGVSEVGLSVHVTQDPVQSVGVLPGLLLPEAHLLEGVAYPSIVFPEGLG